jgi:hypothetical protein
LRERLQQDLSVAGVSNQPCISKARDEPAAVLLGGLECPEIV